MQTPSEREAGGESGRAAHLALARAVLYEAISLAFRRPTPDALERLTGSDTAVLIEAARAVEEHAGPSRLVAVCRALAEAARWRQGLPADFERLFGHTARGEVPPYETEYGDDDLFQQPQELSDLAGFMRAFGLTVDPRAHERIDHVSCQCEFLSFLACKQAWAIRNGDREMESVSVEASRLFLRDHLARFGVCFAQRLVRADPDGLYGRVGSLLLAFLRVECERLRVTVGPEQLRLRLPAIGCVPMGCGSAAEVCDLPGAGRDDDEG